MFSVKDNGEVLISIIIPTYNRKDILKEAIDSILLQSYYNYEIIIIDDCSSDGTEQYIKSKYNKECRIKYYKNETNSGAGISRKNGYSKSNGDYLIFMDDDDYYTDCNFFKKAIQIFKQYKNELSFVSSNSLIKYEKTNEYEFKPLNIKEKIDNLEYLINFQIKYMKANSTFTTIFNKKFVKDIDKANMLNDSSIYMRALLVKPAYIIEDIIGVYRVHDKNMTFNLKLKFLLENLEEKKYIYYQLKEKIEEDRLNKWWYEQVMLTTKYYVNNSKPTDKEFKTLIEWCLKNGEVQKETIVYELKRAKKL